MNTSLSHEEFGKGDRPGGLGRTALGDVHLSN